MSVNEKISKSFEHIGTEHIFMYRYVNDYFYSRLHLR